MTIEERWLFIKKSDNARREGLGIAFIATAFGILLVKEGFELAAIVYLVWMIPVWLILLRDMEKTHRDRIQLRMEMLEREERQEKVVTYTQIKKDGDLTVVEIESKSGIKKKLKVQLVEEEREGILLTTVLDEEKIFNDEEKVQMLIHPILFVPKKKQK